MRGRIRSIKIPKQIRRVLRKVLTKDKSVLFFRKTPQGGLYSYELFLFDSDGQQYGLSTVFLASDGKYVEKRVTISKKDVDHLREMVSAAHTELSLSKLLADGKMRRREDDQILETSHRRFYEREACDADRYKRTIHG